MSKHTKGPWRAERGDYGFAISASAAAGGSIVAVWPETANGTKVDAEANAHLIAAAHVLGRGESWSVLITRQDIGRAPREIRA